MATSNRPDIDAHHRHRRRMEIKVVSALFIALIPWIGLILPQSLVQMLTPESINGAVTRMVGATAITPLCAWALFASDPITRGSGKVARWFRSQFASELAIKRFVCSNAEASELWFKFFDTWGYESSPHHRLMQSTYAATYAMRFIAYVHVLLAAFTSATIVVIGLNIALGKYGLDGGRITLGTHTIVASSYAVALIYVRVTNRLPTPSQAATGCYHRVQDILGRSRVVFAREVLDTATSYEEAMTTVMSLRKELNVK